MKLLMFATFNNARHSALERARLLLITAWVGSLWAIGYLVAPVLFHIIADSALAGTVAGRLFYIEACFSVVVGLVLIAFSYYQYKRLPWLVLGMLFCTIVGYFVLHPFMADLRETGLIDPDVKWRFGILHGISSGLYLMQSILGAMLVLELLDKKSCNS